MHTVLELRIEIRECAVHMTEGDVVKLLHQLADSLRQLLVVEIKARLDQLRCFRIGALLPCLGVAVAVEPGIHIAAVRLHIGDLRDKKLRAGGQLPEDIADEHLQPLPCRAELVIVDRIIRTDLEDHNIRLIFRKAV